MLQRNSDYNEPTDETTDCTPLLLDPSIQAVIHVGPSSSTSGDNEAIVGDVFVTNSQVLFVAQNQEEHQHDFAIGASCIVLHAMMDEPKMVVYLQLNNTDETVEEETTLYAHHDYSEQFSELTEITIEPLDQECDCQRLFDSLCKLVALHSTLDDGEEESDMMPLGFGEEDELIWAPPTALHDVSTHEDATQESRREMLARLDNLLIVPTELEIDDGQFADAAEIQDGGESEEGDGKEKENS